jgi:CelD/BcsL family acetyltransferase involved in cellulose biosynthesis
MAEVVRTEEARLSWRPSTADGCVTVLRREIIESEEDLAGLLGIWDELAVANRLPYGAPAWMLSWWHHLAPRSAQLRVVTAWEGNELVGIVSLYTAPESGGVLNCRLLGARYGGTPLGPLAVAGREPEVAGLLGASLRGMRPRPRVFHFDGIRSDSPWVASLKEEWPGPGSPLMQVDARRPTPVVHLEGRTFDEWLAGQSKNFRQNLRRKQRQLEDLGATFRMSGSTEEAERDLEHFVRLHESRWDWRGGSGRIRASTKDFLAELARELLPLGRFRLWSIEVDGVPISSHLFVSAGGRTNYWLGGFDDAWGRYSPAMITLLFGIQHAAEQGDSEVGLGAGRQGYKGRFTAEAEEMDWLTVVPPHAIRSPRVWVGVAPKLAMRGVGNRVSPETRARLTAVSKKAPGWARW